MASLQPTSLPLIEGKALELHEGRRGGWPGLGPRKHTASGPWTAAALGQPLLLQGPTEQGLLLPFSTNFYPCCISGAASDVHLQVNTAGAPSPLLQQPGAAVCGESGKLPEALIYCRSLISPPSACSRAWFSPHPSPSFCSVMGPLATLGAGGRRSRQTPGPPLGSHSVGLGWDPGAHIS